MRCLVLILFYTLFVLDMAQADPAAFSSPGLSTLDPPKPQRFEIYSGVDYLGPAVCSYSSSAWAPFGSLDEAGIRLRADTLTSFYSQTSAKLFTGSGGLGGAAGVSAGYAFGFDRLFVKVYGGAGYENQNLWFSKGNSEILAPSLKWGANVSGQTFLHINEKMWAVFDMRWRQINSESDLYAKVAYEVWRSPDSIVVSAGAEVNGDFQSAIAFDQGRKTERSAEFFKAGPLLNVRWGKNDLTLSSGVWEDRLTPQFGAYATLSFGRKF